VPPELQAHAMQQRKDAILRRLGEVLHVHLDDSTHEPLPERWVDLINSLNAQEEERRQAQTPPNARRRPLPH
jgi:hypothetical protein